MPFPDTAKMGHVKFPNFSIQTKLILILIFTAVIPLIVTNILWVQYSNSAFIDFCVSTTEIFLKPGSISLVTIGLVVFLVILVSYWTSTQIIKPLKNLIQGSQYITNGHFEYRLKIHSKDEMEVLGNSFNLMAMSLQDAFQKTEHNKDVILAERNKLAITLSNIVDGIIVVDLNLNIVLFNSAAENLTGMKATEVIGKRVGEVIRLTGKGREITEREYCPVTKDLQGKPVFVFEELKLTGRSKESFVNLISSQMKVNNATQAGYILTLHDVTKERQFEDMKLDFVSMAAHELRTPLTSIKGYLSVFINENQNKLTPDQLIFIKRINTSTQQLSGLVDNLLSVARVERGILTLHNQIIDWVNNVGTQMETFLHRADEKRITLTFIKPEKPIPKVNVDLIRINEVLNNLISNALNYTEPQGKIDVWIDFQDGMVLTYVKDTGRGIPKEALPYLFSKFFRIQGGPAEQSSKGNGLGLYLSKAIIELHNGKIWAQSEGLGNGSIFAFSLPPVSDNININVLSKSL